MDLTEHRRQAARYFERISAECIHYLSVDCVVFGFHENQLKVLLLRWKGTEAWSLPGGFIRKDESVEDAAQRCLMERTGLKKIYLQHFDVFGEVSRYDEPKTFKTINLNLTSVKWSERTVSIGYFALVEHSKVTPAPDFLTAECSWMKINEIPSLLFDHNKIVKAAVRALHIKLPFLPIRHLLPPNFTMPELQKLYETILDRQLDARNFQRKINALRILEKLSKRREGTPHKSPFLYRFSSTRYATALKEGSLVFS